MDRAIGKKIDTLRPKMSEQLRRVADFILCNDRVICGSWRCATKPVDYRWYGAFPSPDNFGRIEDEEAVVGSVE
jgi:hypothetical protein